MPVGGAGVPSAAGGPGSRLHRGRRAERHGAGQIGFERKQPWTVSSAGVVKRGHLSAKIQRRLASLWKRETARFASCQHDLT